MNVLGCGLGEAYGPFWASVSMAYPSCPPQSPKIDVQQSIRNQWRHSTKFLWFSSFPLDMWEGERGERSVVFPSVWLSSLCSDTISITEDWEVWKVFKTFFLISNQLSCVNQYYCTDSGLTRLLIRTLDRTVIRTLFLSAECSVDSRHEQQGLPPVNSLSLSPGIWDCWE